MTKVNLQAFYFRFFKWIFLTGWLWLILILILISAKASFFLIGLFIILMFLLPAAFAYIEYNNLGYNKTEPNSLTLTQGLFSIETRTIPYIKITNASFYQSFFQRFFSVGDVLIDQEDSQFRWKLVDKQSAHAVIDEIASKSNIQPITKTK